MQEVKTTIAQAPGQLFLTHDKGLWILDSKEGPLEPDGRLLMKLAACVEGAMTLNADYTYLSAAYDRKLHDATLQRAVTIAVRNPGGALHLPTQEMNDLACIKFGLPIEKDAPEPEYAPFLMPITAQIGTRAESGYPRNATLVMGPKHLAVELDGNAHLLRHTGLEYDRTVETPYSPDKGDEMEIWVDMETEISINGLTISLSPGSINLHSEGEDWAFDPDGLEIHSHGQCLFVLPEEIRAE